MNKTNVILMKSKEFKQICTESNNISDLIQIKVLNSTINFKIKTDFGVGNIEYKKESKQVSILTNKVTSNTFSLKHLAIFSKCASICENVSIILNQDEPLKCEYQLQNNDKLIYYLAPQIE